MSAKPKKKICFIAHEFGFFSGHGGVAAYLSHMVRMLLDHYDYEIHVLAGQYDPKDPSLPHIHFHRFDYSDFTILKLLRDIQPDYVECVEYHAFCYRAILLKALGVDFLNTTFILNHHTNVGECFVWSEELPMTYASRGLQIEHVIEQAKFRLVDRNIAPCHFLKNYLHKNYALESVDVYNYAYTSTIKSKEACYQLIEKRPDVPTDSFNIFYIARFEGRKKQAFLVEQFIKLVSTADLPLKLFLIGNSLISGIDGEDQMELVYRSIPEKYRKHVHFFGFMNLAQQESVIGVADLYVMASTFENFPFSVVDVVYRGIPVMCSKYCGISDVLGETHDAMTFDPFAENDLAEKLRAFSTLDKKARNQVAHIQGSTMQEAMGTASLSRKVKDLFSKKIERDTINVRDMPQLFITERDLPEPLVPTQRAHYILSARPDPNITTFLNRLGDISTKLTDCLIIFHTGEAPLTVLEALERGCSLALLAARLNDKEEPYQQILKFALNGAQMIPIDLPYTHAFSRKFHGFAFREINQINLKELFHG